MTRFNIHSTWDQTLINKASLYLKSQKNLQKLAMTWYFTEFDPNTFDKQPEHRIRVKEFDDNSEKEANFFKPLSRPSFVEFNKTFIPKR